MNAKPGDWLIVEIAGTGHATRRAQILEVGTPAGAPPFTVRWLDTGGEGLVFPGDEARVMTQEELDAHDARTAGRAVALQQLIAARRGTP